MSRRNKAKSMSGNLSPFPGGDSLCIANFREPEGIRRGGRFPDRAPTGKDYHHPKVFTFQGERARGERRNTVRKSKAGKEKGGAHKRTAPFQKQLLFMGHR